MRISDWSSDVCSSDLLVLMLIDARAGVTPLDAHFADWLRRVSTPVVLLANKCEGRAGLSGLAEAYTLGLGDPVPISAEHGEGMGELYDRSEEHTSELQSLMRTSYAVFCLKKKKC